MVNKFKYIFKIYETTKIIINYFYLILNYIRLLNKEYFLVM